MFTKSLKIILGVILSVVLYGCPANDPDQLWIRFANRSDVEVILLVNPNYPDSSLKYTYVDKFFRPEDIMNIGPRQNLGSKPGVTVFVFDHGYFKDQWNDGSGKPDTYLAEDKILKKFVMTKAQLDSAGWNLSYP